MIVHRYRRMIPVILLAAAEWLTGCQPAGSSWPDDVLVVGQVAEPRSLDPHVATSLNDFRILVNLYEGLVRFADGSLEIEPALAVRWTVSHDGLSYRFELRRNVRFHDGTPFDAEAVKFNLDRLRDPSHPYSHTGPFPLAFFFDPIREVEVIDPHQVVLHLDEPFAPLLANLAYPTGLMVSPAAVRRYGKAFGRNPVGTGPFRFAGWDPGRRVVIERNPDYHGRSPPLRTIVFRPLTDPMTRIAELMAGGVDLVAELAPDQVALLRSDPHYRVYEQVGPHLWFLILNLREAPFRDRRMRLAVNLAIDREGIVERILQGTAAVATGPVPAAFGWAHDAGLEPFPHDPERARALVEEAGYDEGVEITLLAPQEGSGMLAPVQMATAIQADLAEVGIRARIETYEWNSYLARVNAGLEGRGDMAEMAWMTNDPDTLPYLALRSTAVPDQGGFNSGYYSNPEVDRLIDAARVETDRQQRAEIYRELEQQVLRDLPWAIVASWRQNVVAQAQLHGFRLQPSFFLLLDKTYKLADSPAQARSEP
jgi:peptide/nickel transport system substrate-binding protein